MVLTFRSSIPESFTLIGVDSDGRKRVCVASKNDDDFHWQLALSHPSGQTWSGSFHGPNVLDALTEMLASKDSEFKQDRARGDRPHEERFDPNRAVNDGSEPIKRWR